MARKTEKPPLRRLIVGVRSVGQKGTTISVSRRKQTWPMVTTAGSRERVRFVFIWLLFLLFVIDGAKLRKRVQPFTPDRAVGGMERTSGPFGQWGAESPGLARAGS